MASAPRHSFHKFVYCGVGEQGFAPGKAGSLALAWPEVGFRSGNEQADQNT